MRGLDDMVRDEVRSRRMYRSVYAPVVSSLFFEQLPYDREHGHRLEKTPLDEVVAWIKRTMRTPFTDRTAVPPELRGIISNELVVAIPFLDRCTTTPEAPYPLNQPQQRN
jgi:hypothetical protein